MSEEITSQGTEISIRDYLDLLRRRKTIIIQTFVVILVVGVVITLMSKPVFRTGGRILVETRTNNFVSQGDSGIPLSALFNMDPGHDVSTQIEVMQGSKPLAEAYAKAGVRPGSVRLDVKQVNNTEVIEYTAESSDATAAERLAAQLPLTYRSYVTGNQNNELAHALNFTTDRLNEEKIKLNEAEHRLQIFRERRKVASVDEQIKKDVQKQGDIEKAIRVAESDVAGAVQTLKELRHQRGITPKFVKSKQTTSNNMAIQALKDKIAGLETDKAGLGPTYTEKNLKVISINQQIAKLKDQLNNTPENVVTITDAPNPEIASIDADIVKAEVDLATKREAFRLAMASKTDIDLSVYGELERMQASLTQDVEHHRTLMVMFTKTFEDLSLRAQTTHDPVTVIAGAGKAVQVAPRTANNIFFAAVIGLLLGVCFALLQEYLDDRINTPDEARKIIEAPVLSYVPLVEAEETRLLTRARGGGSLLESYRVMRANVQFAAVDTTTNSIVVTSTSPGEGKSVTSSNLAVAMALDGRRVILVDADLRRPTLHEKFDVDQRPGLTNVLVGHTPLVDALKETEIPGLRILTAGPLPPNPAELLNSISMRAIHEELRSLADVVIFDSPPFLATADSQVLAAMADGVIYVVQFGEAKKSAVRHAVDLIHQAHARVLGVVFNKIDLTSRRDDYYYGYYRYYNYYHTPQLESGEPRKRRSTTEFDGLLAGANGQGGDNSNGAKTAVVKQDDVAVVGALEDREKEERG